MSMVTLAVAAAMYTQYWDSGFGMTAATFVILVALFFMNACGVEVGGLFLFSRLYTPVLHLSLARCIGIRWLQPRLSNQLLRCFCQTDRYHFARMH